MTFRFRLTAQAIVLAGLLALPLQGEAQAPAAAAAPFRLITLGTIAGPFPRKDRAQMASLLEVDGEFYLIDAGDGVSRRLAEADVDINRIGRIFITHDHGDHTAGLANMFSVAWQNDRRQPIEVIGPPGTDLVVNGALAADKADEEIRLSETRETPLKSVVRVKVVGTGVVYQDAKVKVTAVENTHFQFKKGSPAYGKYKSYAYRFDIGPRSIVFTGDTGPSPAVTALARGADILVSEVLASDEIRVRLEKTGEWQKQTPTERQGWIMHMTQEHLSPDKVGEMARDAGVKTLVLSHIGGGVPGDDFARFGVAAGKVFKGRIIVAKDLMQITP
ncbi:MAG TPA: MBL fold metallo-hydrolase [Caulobacteraceae bacterium]|jgi:ribonuclease BN (tRNA processing enzyme)